MKIGIGSGSFYLDDPTDREGLIAGFKEMKSYGYDCVDAGVFCNTETALFEADAAEFDRLLSEYRKIAEDAGITVNQAHGPWRWPSRDNTEEDRAERFEKMARSLHGAAVLGCPLVIHPIMPNKEHDDPVPGRLWALNVDFFTRLAKVAEAEGVILCLENMPMPDYPLATPQKTLELVKATGSNAVKMCLDTGHCTMCCGDETVGDQVRFLGKDMMRVLHVHDNNGVNDYHWMPYDGVIDWADFAASLKEIGFDGTVSLEVHPFSHKMPIDARRDMEIGRFKLAKSLT